MLFFSRLWQLEAIKIFNMEFSSKFVFYFILYLDENTEVCNFPCGWRHGIPGVYIVVCAYIHHTYYYSLIEM
jgi:aspartate 1-decarboxylase